MRVSLQRLRPRPSFSKPVHDAEALLVVAEAAGEDLVQGALPRVAEGRVAQVVAERDGLRQVLVQAQGAGYRPRDPRPPAYA